MSLKEALEILGLWMPALRNKSDLDRFKRIANMRYRDLAKVYHPDFGGDIPAMTRASEAIGLIRSLTFKHLLIQHYRRLLTGPGNLRSVVCFIYCSGIIRIFRFCYQMTRISPFR